MGVAQGVDELAGLEARHLRHHHGQQRVGGDVEGKAEKDVGAALVELAGEPALGHVELEEGVAGGERHAAGAHVVLRAHPLVRQVRHVPGAHQDATRVRPGADLLHRLGDLVHGAPVGRAPGAPLAPVDGAELAVLRGPFVPDGHAVLVQVADVGLAAQEPQQLVDDRAQVQALGGDRGKARGEVEAHLPAEDAERARAGAVLLAHAVLEHVPHEVEILSHPPSLDARR